MAASLHYKKIIDGLKQYFHMTVKSIKYSCFDKGVKSVIAYATMPNGIMGSKKKLICRQAQLISESYNNSYNRVKITPRGGVTIFGVNITPKRSYFFL